MDQIRSKNGSLLDERCLCGSLVAKLSPKGVEILCRRCKRIHIIPWSDDREPAMLAPKQHVA
jgi:phage FluMu protein Com